VRIGRTSRGPVCGISRLENSTRRPRRHVARTTQNCYHWATSKILMPFPHRLRQRLRLTTSVWSTETRVHGFGVLENRWHTELLTWWMDLMTIGPLLVVGSIWTKATTNFVTSFLLNKPFARVMHSYHTSAKDLVGTWRSCKPYNLGGKRH